MPGCRETEFYDVTAFVCRECPTNAVGYIDPEAKGVGATTAVSCKCKPGFILPEPSSQAGGLQARNEDYACTPCPKGTAPNMQGNACVKCGSGMEVGTKLLTAAGKVENEGNGLPVGQCTCPEGDVFQYIRGAGDTASAGGGRQAAAYSLGCKTCPAGQYAGPGWECKKCADYREEYVRATSGAWTCSCRYDKNAGIGYIRAGGTGSSCVTQADYDAVVADIPGQ